MSLEHTWRNGRASINYTERVISHPRYGMLMLALILLSFINQQAVVTVPSLLFAAELNLRVLLMLHSREIWEKQYSSIVERIVIRVRQ